MEQGGGGGVANLSATRSVTCGCWCKIHPRAHNYTFRHLVGAHSGAHIGAHFGEHFGDNFGEHLGAHVGDNFGTNCDHESKQLQRGILDTLDCTAHHDADGHYKEKCGW